MKKILNSIKKYITTGANFIWHYIKVSFNYIIENAWIQPIIIVLLLFGIIFGIQGIINVSDDIAGWFRNEEESSEHLFTKMTYEELGQKREADEDFIFFIGYDECGYCQQYYDVVDQYIRSYDEEVFYLDVGRDSSGSYLDPSLEDRHMDELLEEFQDVLWHVSAFDGAQGISTPTSVIVENGEFVDANVGFIEGTDFLEFMAGENIPE